MHCVLVSKSLDLRGYLGPQFMRAADRIEIVSHPHQGPATDVRLAVAWHPPDDAFERYPNRRRSARSAPASTTFWPAPVCVPMST